MKLGKGLDVLPGGVVTGRLLSWGASLFVKVPVEVATQPLFSVKSEGGEFPPCRTRRRGTMSEAIALASAGYATGIPTPPVSCVAREARQWVSCPLPCDRLDAPNTKGHCISCRRRCGPWGSGWVHDGMLLPGCKVCCHQRRFLGTRGGQAAVQPAMAWPS